MSSASDAASSVAGTLSFRTACEDDLPHMAELSGAAGGDIVPAGAGGGDFVLQAWKSWWQLEVGMHFNQWCFCEARPAGFVRIECYGSAAHPESGWLTGLRVHPQFQGHGIMNKVIMRCLEMVPAHLRSAILLAVGSSNERMVAISDARYQYLGGMITYRFDPAAAPPAAIAAAADALTVRTLGSDDLPAAWAVLSAQPAAQSGRAFMPGKFYAFRLLTRAAIAEKLEARRAYGVFGAAAAGGAPPLLALLLAYDTEIERDDAEAGELVIAFHTCVLAPLVEDAAAAAALHAFARARQAERGPLVQAAGKTLRTCLTAGPFLPPTGSGAGSADEAVLQPSGPQKDALEAARFNRLLDTHLRVYHM